MNHTDHKLLQTYLAEDSQEAFRELMRRHARMVYSTAYRIVDDSMLAEDICQQVFVLFVEKAPQLKSETLIAGWFYRTALFTAKTALRSRARSIKRERFVAEMAEPQVEENVSSADGTFIKKHLDEAIDSLPGNLRDAVICRFLEEKSRKDASEILGIKEKALDKRISRAIAKLQQLLAGKGVTVTTASLSLVLSTQVTEVKAAMITTSMVESFTIPSAVAVNTHLTGGIITVMGLKKNIALGALAVTTMATSFVGGHYYQQQAVGLEVAAPEAPASPQARTQQYDLSALEGELNRLQEDLAQQEKHGQALADENEALLQKIRSYQSQLEQVDDEIILSYGTLEESGRYIGELLSSFGKRYSDLTEEEAQQKYGEAFLALVAAGRLFQEIKAIEEKPEEFARFHTELIQGIIGDVGEEQKIQIGDILERNKRSSLNHDKESEAFRALESQTFAEIEAVISSSAASSLKSVFKNMNTNPSAGEYAGAGILSSFEFDLSQKAKTNSTFNQKLKSRIDSDIVGHEEGAK